MDLLKELKPVTLADGKIFKECFAHVAEPVADTTFAMRYIWAGPLRHAWAMINGNLCVFGFDKGRHVVWGPPVGGENLSGTISACFGIVGGMNSAAGISAKPAAIYIPECLKKEYEGIAEMNGWGLSYWTQDYIYRREDLAGLAGSRFDSKRHKANQFEKSFAPVVEEFDPARHSDACLELVELWRMQKEEVVADAWRSDVASETEVAKQTVKFARQLGVKGVVVKVEGDMVGVSLGEQLMPGVCSNIIEKTNSAFTGAAQFIFREFARHWAGCEFIDAQDDFGVDYLKAAKLSYHPARLLPSYVLEKK